MSRSGGTRAPAPPPPDYLGMMPKALSIAMAMPMRLLPAMKPELTGSTVLGEVPHVALGSTVVFHVPYGV